ncbi:hypothetical protein D910_00146 [Dendroctonus ponderosae]|uniref:Tyrosine-protein phosphatase domain-containing protein n=1 Tax=Dendroctonus ponderosae TaxID=77166 RepID=U4UZ79_DENPD|nr:hypothetical protein D910_00146 [Dendroctonus ponderosae]
MSSDPDAAKLKSHSSSGTVKKKPRSRSTPRTNDVDKPRKKRHASATHSFASIPNAIKLSMLNSGLLPTSRFNDENNGTVVDSISDRPIDISLFMKLCEQRKKFPVLYKLEFEIAEKTEPHSCRHGTKKSNLEKNQNQKCIPYDYNRVVLDTIEGEHDSDYVNASYVDSLLKPNAYIVTQGPTEETVTDFWRMVWQEKASCIVMLTKTFDFIKVSPTQIAFDIL